MSRIKSFSPEAKALLFMESYGGLDPDEQFNRESVTATFDGIIAQYE